MKTITSKVQWSHKDAHNSGQTLLNLPNLAAEVLRKRDAKVRDEMLALFRMKRRDYANEIERAMAAELEKETT